MLRLVNGYIYILSSVVLHMAELKINKYYSRTWNCFQSVACYGRHNIDIHLTFMQSREVPYSGGILRSYFNTNNAEQSRQGPGRDAIHGSARKRGLIAIFAIDLVLGSHMNE